MQKIRTIAQWAMDTQRAETDRVLRMEATKIPEDYWGLTWDDYDNVARTKDESVKDILIDYGAHWNPAERMGVVLLGSPGFGKTLGMLILGIELATQRGAWVKYTTEERLDEMRKRLIGLDKQAQKDDDWGDYNTASYQLAFIENECDVLLLDDVGKAYRAVSGYADNKLDALLRRRYEDGKVTCITSNLAHKEWAKIDGSMASFLYDVGEIVHVLEGKDHRARPAPARARRRSATG